MKRLFDRLQVDWYQLPKITRFAQVLLAFSLVVYLVLLIFDGVQGAVYSLFGILLVGLLSAVMCVVDRHWSYCVLDLAVVMLLYFITSLMNPV